MAKETNHRRKCKVNKVAEEIDFEKLEKELKRNNKSKPQNKNFKNNGKGYNKNSGKSKEGKDYNHKNKKSYNKKTLFSKE